MPPAMCKRRGRRYREKWLSRGVQRKYWVEYTETPTQESSMNHQSPVLSRRHDPIGIVTAKCEDSACSAIDRSCQNLNCKSISSAPLFVLPSLLVACSSCARPNAHASERVGCIIACSRDVFTDARSSFPSCARMTGNLDTDSSQAAFRSVDGLPTIRTTAVPAR